MNSGILVIISGFSGAGKGTLVKALMERYENYSLSISATTRSARPGEEDGREYFFKEESAFKEMIQRGEFIEYAKYVEHYYGTPKTYVQQQLASGRDVILEIEIQGARKVKEQMPEAVLFFVTPPCAKELKNRLEKRGTEDTRTIQSRLERGYEEAMGMDQYDYILINDDLERCVETLHGIVLAEHCKTFRQKEFIRKMGKELQIFKKGE